MRKKIGLVLTGGGARAAYQVGVLQGIAEIVARDPADPAPFDILAGTSAGAINSTFLAARVQPFTAGVQALRDFWQGLRAEQVIRTDFRALGGLGLRWLRDLSLGGLIGKSSSTYLLDATPLRSFLADKIDFRGIKDNLQSGLLYAVAISATNYLTGTTVVFYDGAPDVDPWVRSTRLSERADLNLRHVLASAAIPVFFEPVKLNGSFYGDGCVRLTTPLSPAIHLGADKILAIGIRYRRPDEENRELNRTGKMTDISLIDIAGVMLNAAFLDALDTDIERMQRINRTVALLSKLQGHRHPELREIPLLAIRPSQDLGTLAGEHFDRFSAMLRYLLKGIGASSAKGWDLLSYLAFDEAYTGRLIELGYEDALAQRDAITEFFAT